jgi:HSP20 family protein
VRRPGWGRSPHQPFSTGPRLRCHRRTPGREVRRSQLGSEGENSLRLSGTKSFDYEEKASLHRRERIAGSFDRTITLPIRIDPDGIKAEYRDGILALFVPRAESDKPRSIKIG